MTKNQEKPKIQEKEIKITDKCDDISCPHHGSLSARGRVFQGNVIKKFPKRVVIEFERTLYVRKYERYARRKTKLHARISKCLEPQINVGDMIEIRECRPLSKIINFVVIRKVEK